MVLLTKGCEIAAPLSRFPRLTEATVAQRSRYEVVEAGLIVHWPEIDEYVGMSEPLGIPEDELARLAGFTMYD